MRKGATKEREDQPDEIREAERIVGITRMLVDCEGARHEHGRDGERQDGGGTGSTGRERQNKAEKA